MNRKAILRVLVCLFLLTAFAATVQASAATTKASTTTESKMNAQLKPRGKGSYVTLYQKYLKKLGYYTAGISNYFSVSTYNATKTFQRYNGLTVSGKGTKATRDLLFSGNALSKKDYEIKHNILKLTKGDSGSQVQQLQERLMHYGYLQEADGNFDTATYYAIRYFQYANKIKSDGIANKTTRQKLNADTGAVFYETYEAKELAASAKKGSYGLRVKQIKLRLNELGYFKGTINNSFDETLRTSVIRFEQFNNFSKADGAVSTSERKRIASEDAVRYDEVYGADTIKPGASGRIVLRMQIILKDMRLYSGSLNGKYDSRTKSAIKSFQKKNKIYPTGIAYTPTLQAILAKEKVSTSGDARVPLIVGIAQDQLGIRYRSRCNTPSKGFDCSGFTYYVYKKAASYSLNQSSISQASDRRGTPITQAEDVEPGDLVFFATGSDKSKINHVGICTANSNGNVKFIHASSSAGKVVVSAFKSSSNSNFYEKRFIMARRML